MTPPANIIEVDDIDDPRLEDYRDICDRELRGRAGLPGLFIAEQSLVVERMLARPGVAKSVLIAPSRRERIAPLAPPEVPVYVAPLPLVRQVAGFNIHRGVLGIGFRSAVERPALDLPPGPDAPLTVVLCEGITNIDNIGFLFRNAAAFGVDAVLLSPRCHDPLYRKSLRVSIGHALTVPFARSGDWLEDLRRLQTQQHVTLIAAAPDTRAVDVDSVARPRRVGLVVGQEYDGLARATLDLCDRIVKIPMAAGVDSLNVAVAAAVCLHRFSTGRRE
ncbi:MAG: TrmH family RNA methyltransferase [Planctomycetota bacterium]|jgi:tRNA G18 (ribose-2'-O)-methylase SpoU